MLFHTPIFAAFLLVVVVLFFLLPKRPLIWSLIGASYLFYGWVEPRYTLLMLASSVIDYALALRFGSGSDPKVRHRGIWVSAVFNFGVLFYFKYANFAIENVQLSLAHFGILVPSYVLHVALPLGISFYTFHSFSYTVDVLTGRIPPCRSLPEFLLFVSWFPQLVAGPIARAEQMMPQLQSFTDKRDEMAERVPNAVMLFCEGWLRKSFADWTSIAANSFFNGGFRGATTWQTVCGIAAFGLQIYGDFSGYTRMAQGVSWLFGVRLAQNFNRPYIAHTPQDFWRRWHISLSTWFRDYLYIPLGGNRHGTWMTYRNLIVTFLVCGFWHGANWTFVLWGGIHGFLLILERLTGEAWKLAPRFLTIPLMWVLVFLAWVPFRAASLQDTGAIFRAIFAGGPIGVIPSSLAAGAAGIILCDFFPGLNQERTGWRRPELLAVGSVVACVCAWVVNLVFWETRGSQFIYFQF